MEGSTTLSHQGTEGSLWKETSKVSPGAFEASIRVFMDRASRWKRFGVSYGLPGRGTGTRHHRISSELSSETFGGR
jgi:hypothetical protein